MMEHSGERYRLITREDFDGLVCAVLLSERDLIDEIKFAHPRDMQEGLVTTGPRDITANLPYVDTVRIAFDHHLSESLRVGARRNTVNDPKAPSTARVVWNYFGGKAAFPRVREELLEAVDKADTGAFTREEVLEPEGWTMLNFLLDPRTGLGRFGNFRVSNQKLLLDLVDYCREYPVEEVMALPDVAERVELYREHKEPFQEQLRRCARLDGNVLIVDYTGEEEVFASNRFVKYAMYPQANVSVQAAWGFQQETVVMTVGRSIFNRSFTLNIGALMLQYGGGGHAQVGACQVSAGQKDEVLTELVTKLRLSEDELG